MVTKEALYEQLKNSKHANLARPELAKPPKKIKLKHLIEEAAQTIAKTKQEIRDVRRMSFQLQKSVNKTSMQYDKKYATYMRLWANKVEVEEQLNKLKQENSSTIGEKEETLSQLKNGNQMIRAEIETINNWMIVELDERADTRNRLQKYCDSLLFQIHQEKEKRLHYQRAAAATYGSHQELHRLRAENDKQGKKLKILIDLLESSRDHLGNSISKKNELIEQTLQASDQMYELCEKTLEEEQEFYEQRDYDTLLTPPYTQIKRRPRND